jgi:hypothetical protein
LRITFFLVLLFIGTTAKTQGNYELIFPSKENWNLLQEGDTLKFTVRTTAPYTVPNAHFTIEGINDSGIQFDSTGNFFWKPGYDLVDRVNIQKEISVIFEALWPDGTKARKNINFLVIHKNRPPVVDQLPVFYVKQRTPNTYKIPVGELVYDPDDDPIVFRPILSTLPEGASLSAQGVLSWNPSRNQFNNLKEKPQIIEFIVQDQPTKAETIGRIRVSQTQLDLPPEILLVPGDSLIEIKESEVANFKIYVSDPNGDDNILTVGFIANDPHVPQSSLKENTSTQWEFTWMPGYDFTDDVRLHGDIDLNFFVLDKSNNRTERHVTLRVHDAENIAEKDNHLFSRYKNSLIATMNLIDHLDHNNNYLNREYRKAKKGKKNRSIVNAALGATTGISPLVLESDQSKVVSGVGGTTVLTLGTLEATEVIGKSKNDILEKLKINVEIRNQLQAMGDDFARKYALKSARRSPDFNADSDKLKAALHNQKIILLELDAGWKNPNDASDKNLKKTFPDFTSEY